MDSLGDVVGQDDASVGGGRVGCHSGLRDPNERGLFPCEGFLSCQVDFEC